jgi:hypothetical protein
MPGTTPPVYGQPQTPYGQQPAGAQPPVHGQPSGYQPPGYQQPGYPQWGRPPGHGTPADPGIGFSIAGIVLGAVAFLICPPLFGGVGLVFGFVARSKGERLANAAIIVAALGLVIGMILSLAINSSLS